MPEPTYLYSWRETNDSAIGTGHVFYGPGLRGSTEVYLLQPLNKSAQRHIDKPHAPSADVIKWMLQAAYERGREDAMRELRRLIGVAG